MQPPAKAESIFDFLPGRVVVALQEYASQHHLTPTQVVEFAIASFLDLEAITIDTATILSPGQLAEENKILRDEVTRLQNQLRKFGWGPG